ENHGIIASFSRALSSDLNAGQSDEEFDAKLAEAIDSIYDAGRSTSDYFERKRKSRYYGKDAASDRASELPRCRNDRVFIRAGRKEVLLHRNEYTGTSRTYRIRRSDRRRHYPGSN